MRAALLRGSVIAAGALGAVLIGAVPAHADGEWLRINPTTIQAGFSVSIEASCGNNVNPATVKSDAFGEQQMLPQQGSNYLYAVVTVPPDKKPNGYSVTLTCPTGTKATTTLWVITDEHKPSKGPNTGGGGLAKGGSGTTGTTMLIGGVGILGAGAALGLVALRRRRNQVG